MGTTDTGHRPVMTDRVLALLAPALQPPGAILLDAIAARILVLVAGSPPGTTARPPAASNDQRVFFSDGPGNVTAALYAGGVLPPSSPVPGQLAALCERLGITGHGILAAPAAQLPGRWASVLAQRDAAPAGQHQEISAPLATLLPDIEGTRFALTGLTSAAGGSYLDLVASGLPERAGAGPYGWGSGFGWWLRDEGGGWHTAAGNDVAMRSLGEAAAFRLRLVPPMVSCPDTLEVAVTGLASRLRAVVPVRGEGDNEA